MDILDTITFKVDSNIYSYNKSQIKKKINHLYISKTQKFHHVLMLKLKIIFLRQYHIIKDQNLLMLINK